jgi:hypothetical protein
MFDHLATAYGQGNYSTMTYDSDTPLEATSPSAPNIGTVNPSQSTAPMATSSHLEPWLIPAIIIGAVLVAAVVIGIKKLIRTHKA